MSEEKMEKFSKLKVKMKVEEIKRVAVTGVKNTAKWCSENKEITIVVAPMIISSVTKLLMANTQKNSTMDLKRLKENFIYDRRTGQYFETRRPLTNNERLVIEAKKEFGYPIGQTLKEMGLLK